MTNQSSTSASENRLQVWSRRLSSLLLIVFCFELGVFLLLFPWMDAWSNNWVADAAPFLAQVWENGFFRGAVSGLGAINIYISLLELINIRR